jgi:MSHA biogenesis protein MshI
MVRSLGVTQAHLEGDMDSVIERLTLEFQRTLDHFDRQFGGVPVDRLFLIPSEKVGSLRDGLAGNLALPVEVMDLTHALDISAIPNLGELPTPCFHAIGAALRKEDTKP